MAPILQMSKLRHEWLSDLPTVTLLVQGGEV